MKGYDNAAAPSSSPVQQELKLNGDLLLLGATLLTLPGWYLLMLTLNFAPFSFKQLV